MSELEEEIIKSKDSHMSLREKDEQIRDLMSEIKILQQHNSELISLSTRYNKVDNENIELKRKISEQQIDNNSLKSAFNNEKTNITALQAANNQLMEKLQRLQKNMDTLTIQLKVSYYNSLMILIKIIIDKICLSHYYSHSKISRKNQIE